MTARILIADGQATNRITLKVRLSAACYTIETATGLEQALGAAMTRCPDLIILGAGLSEKERLRACARLRSDPETAQIPLLVLCSDDQRLAAMRAGASAVLDPLGDELSLLARVRGMLRDAVPVDQPAGLAEAPSDFKWREAEPGNPKGTAPQVALIADRPARALAWKYALAQHLPCRLLVRDPEQALADIAAGKSADLYLISANIDQPGEGLRLLSELRARAGSRDAAFVVAVPADRADLAAIALDLGAGDTLPLLLAAPDRVEMAVITLQAQLARKYAADGRRAVARRSMTMAMTDPLTGLYNRRYALPRLTEAVRAALHRGAPLSVLAMDIDRFKQINDRYGHAAGDAALREVARRIDATVGDAGLTARMGGEEFLAILPGHVTAEACGFAEAIRTAILGAPVILPSATGGGILQVTLSLGVATLDEMIGSSDPDDLAELLLDRADRAMLAAKTSGRNRVMHCGSGLAA